MILSESYRVGGSHNFTPEWNVSTNEGGIKFEDDANIFLNGPHIHITFRLMYECIWSQYKGLVVEHHKVKQVLHMEGAQMQDADVF